MKGGNIMKYYKVNLSGSCSFRVKSDTDVTDAVNVWLTKVNKGEAKSDRLHLYGIIEVSQHEYNVSLMPEKVF